MKSARIVFMGTPAFAATVLEGLITSGYTIVGLVSQPDRPIGRKQVVEPTPTKKLALMHQIPVFQPEKIRKDYQFLLELAPDVIITCAYGQIVPQAVLDIPYKGCINVHGSLLPRWRGGAPIQRAIMAGDQETGITLMQMIDKMDAGVMYGQVRTPIFPNDTTTKLFERLAIIGRDYLLLTIDDYLEGKLSGIPQKEDQVSFAYNLKREEEHIPWEKSAIEIERLVRAFSEQPGSFSNYKDTEVKIWNVQLGQLKRIGIPGVILQLTKEGMEVQTGEGSVWVKEIQIPGKKRMPISSLIQGHHFFEINTKLT